tara:strand:+ start:1249 stop:1431 length:183 start_codon:yes stop_codon:yes gene_type:complete
MDIFVFMAGLFGQLLGFLIIFNERFNEAKIKEIASIVDEKRRESVVKNPAYEGATKSLLF